MTEEGYPQHRSRTGNLAIGAPNTPAIVRLDGFSRPAKAALRYRYIIHQFSNAYLKIDRI